ncbi:MAG: ComF family protein [Armatimonadota bacterium]
MDIHKMVREMLDLVFPPACVACGRVGEVGLCAMCGQEIIRVEPPYCSHCGKPFDPNTRRPPQICIECRSDLSPFDGARALALHTGPLRRVIITYKFQGRTRLAPYLADLLVNVVETEAERDWPLPLEDADVVMPVPLHPDRLRWRGFDQAVLIARELAPKLDMPLAEDNLERTKPTLPQIGLSPQQRRDNLKNAFSVQRPGEVSGKSVLLIDDVYTTGATATDASRAVQAAGAARVFFLTVTRSVPAWHPAAQIQEPPVSTP